MVVYFVCTGNICRSVLGHYIFENIVKNLKDNIKDNIKVDSFGMGRFAGNKKPPKFIIEALKKRNIDASSHISKHKPKVFDKDALYITFVNSHTKELEEQGLRVLAIKDIALIVPDSCKKGVSVPDPYFYPDTTDDICELIESSIPLILEAVECN